MSDSKKKYDEMREEAEGSFDLIIEELKLRDQILDELDSFKQRLIQILEQ